MSGSPVLDVAATEAVRSVSAGTWIVDVRGEHEVAQMCIPGAIVAPWDADDCTSVVDRLASLSPPGVIVCASGHRSRAAVRAARSNGVHGWQSIIGGLEAWHRAGGKVATPETGLDAEHLMRFERQLRLPQVGTAGQAKLRAARVLVVGAGGLGCPVTMQLAAAGVGRIGLVDADDVSVSNLHRQLAFTMADVGRAKVDVLADRALELGLELDAPTWRAWFDDETSDAITSTGWDVVVDCTDSIDARYAIARAAHRAALPVVHGSIYRFEGRVAVFPPGGSPCWACAYPSPPTGALAPDCSTAGVVGPVPSLIGAVQALEVIRLLVGAASPLAGSVMVWDLERMETTRFTLPARADCDACGTARA